MAKIEWDFGNSSIMGRSLVVVGIRGAKLRFSVL